MSNESQYQLHEAAKQGNVGLAEQLVKSAPGEAKVKDEDGRLPIHWACSSNLPSVVQSLADLPGFDPDAQDESGWTPLMIAANVSDSAEVLATLLSKEADVNQRNNNGQTALHLVASKANMDVAHKLLAQHPPASTRVRDNRGQYPIHRAAAAGSIPMTTLLLSHKSPVDATDKSGYTALHHAIAEGHGDVAVTLMKAGADPTKRTGEGMAAIDLAPDKEVRRYIQRMAEEEGIEL